MIGGVVWAVYGLAVFFLLVILFFPFYLLFLGVMPQHTTRYVIGFNHHVFPRIFFPLVGILLRVHNRDLISSQQTYIIISNHRSALDFIANPVAFQGIYKFLAKKELARIPLLGFLVKRLCILVDRRNPASAAKSMDWLRKTLEDGYSIFVYPEGTRNRTSHALGPFYSGAFRLALELQVPIAVMTLQNVHNRSAKARALDLWPGVLHIKWSGIIDPKSYKDQAQLQDAARRLMERDLFAGW
jgi:1-acyl-sn-glycerol-3-phosphate acyltransferase